MGNCVEVCHINSNSEKLFLINELHEKFEGSSFKLRSPNYNFDKSTNNLSISLISNKLMNLNNRNNIIDKNRKFKINLIKCDKFDFDKSIEEELVSNSINDFNFIEDNSNNQNDINDDENKNGNRKKYKFHGPIYTHLIQRKKNRNKMKN